MASCVGYPRAQRLRDRPARSWIVVGEIRRAAGRRLSRPPLLTISAAHARIERFIGPHGVLPTRHRVARPPASQSGGHFPRATLNADAIRLRRGPRFAVRSGSSAAPSSTNSPGPQTSASRLPSMSQGKRQTLIVRATARPLLLYSTNSWLAFMIAEQYYRQVHWVWCSPFFRPAASGPAVATPVSSTPGHIYDTLISDIESRDGHSNLIEQNRLGIIRGAQAKRKARTITHRHCDEIVAIARDAPIHDFAPLVFVMPFETVSHLLTRVPPDKRAHPLSAEYIAKALPRKFFDIISLRSTSHV